MSRGRSLRAIQRRVNRENQRIAKAPTITPGVAYFGGGNSDMANDTTRDAFGRSRVSEPLTIFDSKQIFDNQPLFWDESLESGAGISSAHSTDTASTVVTSTDSTAGVFTRQTFMRFNYQPGKSQMIMLTGVLQRSGGGAGVKRRIGMFDDGNGLFFEDDAGTVRVVRRTNVTGSPVDNAVAQSAWSVDKMNGNLPSGITIDWTKTQIFAFDFEWLGVGSVRMCLVVDGKIYVVHEFLNTNILDKVYMSTPNLPLRFQMVTTADSPATTMEAICGTVISEGGVQDLGVLRYKSTEGIHVDANVANTVYALVGLRLKASTVAASVRLVSKSVISQTGDDTEWMLILNPTVAGGFTYSDEANSVVQSAVGATANTVTGGTVIAGGFFTASGGQGGGGTETLDNAIRLGAAIDGTVDEVVLCARPLSSNADIEGGLTWREDS